MPRHTRLGGGSRHDDDILGRIPCLLCCRLCLLGPMQSTSPPELAALLAVASSGPSSTSRLVRALTTRPGWILTSLLHSCSAFITTASVARAPRCGRGDSRRWRTWTGDAASLSSRLPAHTKPIPLRQSAAPNGYIGVFSDWMLY
jgi:hypothetical protein